MDQTIYLLTYKGVPRPGRSTMAIWNDEEYLVANLIEWMNEWMNEKEWMNEWIFIKS